MKLASLQTTLQTFKSEAHWLLSTQAAQEAHTIPGVLNLGHPPEHTDSQTHLIAALCLLRPSQQRKLLQGLLQEEEVMGNPPQDQTTNPKTHNISGTCSTSPSGEPLAPLMGLEGLAALEDQETHQTFPPLILSPSNQPET
jgi:hypothetical protein